MKACLNTIQQTLTAEAASVLKQSIAEAGRRNHGQTTPLHVAATLLVSPTGFLRQACIRSHPNSSHPLQCRALELCFSVALERLPTTAGADNSAEPPLSNALMAALKRAQAHQRRGCPEQQQQPLLAVKVELVQFIISILDDPSVSRVMREASFSSPAVKAAIEQSLMTSSSSSPSPSSPAVSRIGLGFRPMPPTATPPPLSGRTVYLNPRLQTQQQQQNINPNLAVQSSGDDVRKVIEILSRTRKKNPILVGESEPETVLREVLRRIEKRELGESGPLSNVEVVSVDKELGFVQSAAPLRLSELGSLVEMRMKMLVSAGGGLILDLGDLRWLVDQPPGFGLPHQGVSDVAREAVADMGKLIARFRGEDGVGAGGGRLWVIGTATCETYLRCQVYHPSMENEWDLQAVPIAARAPLHSKFPRLVTNSMESYSHLKNLPTTMHPMIRTERSVPQNLDPSRKISCCPQCLDNYEKEVSKLSAGQPEKPVSEVPEATRLQLPQWLQNAKNHTNEEKGTLGLSQNKDQHEPALKQKSEELMKKWSDKCLLLHPSFHHNSTHERINPKPLTLTSMYANPNLFGRQPFQPFQPKSHQPKTLGDDLRLNMNSLTNLPTDRLQSLPLSPVRTDLILGQTKTPESPTTKNTHVDEVKDLLSCMSSESPVKVSELQSDKPLDADSFKKLLKGLIDKVWWQRDAASAVTATVTRCKLGNGRKRAGGAKGDIWMLFSGPDRTGKKKMVTALSEQVCGAGPVIICLGSTRDKEESDMNFRGKTVLDRIAEAVRRYPFSVIMLQDIDEADMLVRGSIKRAMERGRFTDSYGREISLGSIIFILSANNRPPLLRGNLLDEEKLGSLVSSDWQLRISVGKPNKGGAKRHLSWMAEDDGERASKQRREAEPSLSFDLNEMADVEEDRIDGSDLTVEYEEDKGHSPTTTSASHEFIELVDESIVFKPVEFGLLRKSIERTIMTQFRDVLGENLSISIESEALDKILGGAWLGNSGLDSWVEEALVPAIQQLKTTLPAEECVVARLELDEKPEAQKEGDWLPSRVAVSVVGG